MLRSWAAWSLFPKKRAFIISDLETDGCELCHRLARGNLDKAGNAEEAEQKRTVIGKRSLD